MPVTDDALFERRTTIWVYRIRTKDDQEVEVRADRLTEDDGLVRLWIDGDVVGEFVNTDIRYWTRDERESDDAVYRA